MSDPTMPQPQPSRPLLRVVAGGTPTDEELAALVVALAATASAASADEPPPSCSRWADRAHLQRAPLRPGPGSWRASAWRY